MTADEWVSDLREVTGDLIEALYLCGGYPFVIDVPLERLRGFVQLAFPCLPGRGHPLIETARAYLAGACRDYRGSPLERFSQGWRPANAAEAMGFAGKEASRELAAALPTCTVLPWSGVKVAEAARRLRRTIRQENRVHGADLGIAHGTTFYGHSEEKGQLELKRLIAVVESVRERGYCRSDSPGGDIAGYPLIRGGEWAVVVRGGGQHRAAALAALGWTRAPVRIGVPSDMWPPGGVRREDAASWPQVQSRLFTRAQALDLFDRMLEGRQPPACPIVAADPSARTGGGIAAAPRGR